jgi:alkylation response protein AidB-like acyl-CoA dehydrogenase
MQQTGADRSLGELFAELAREMSTLFRQEVELARTEMTAKASRIGREVGFLAIGGAVAYAGLLAVLAAVIIVLAQLGLPWWLSALVVGLAVAGLGYFLVRKGLDALKHLDAAPRQTLESIKEDARWAKEQVK